MNNQEETEDRPEYSVWMFYTNGTHHAEENWRWLKAEPAVKLAVELTQRPIVQAGVVDRIVITDGGDFTIWEWKPEEGITYPPELAGKFKYGRAT